MRESIDAFGDRYLTRVYTEDELETCRRDPRLLAARFAGKEAAMKALACTDRLPWQSIAVTFDDGGCPALELRGAAELAARAQGVSFVSIALSHVASHAAAVVVTEAN